ncbi:MAG: hypothetical protein ABR608_06580 [Pseudonocardiaceae bacterium]
MSTGGTASSATARHHHAPEQTSWVGWVLFAGCMLIILSAFQVITGLVALLKGGYYVVTSDDLLISIDYPGWGWIHLIVGVLVLAAGFGVFARQAWARVVGIVFAGTSAIVNLGFLAASPLGAVLLIALDVIVIYALSVHGREVQY